MRLNALSNMNFTDSLDFSMFAEYIDYTELQSSAHTIAQIYAVCCFGAIMSTIGYMVFCVPSPEEVETRRRYNEVQDYNKGYVDELEELVARDLTEEELTDLTLRNVVDETPFGRVVMTYSSETESYWYYTDNKNIPYMSLDAMARKFACKYDCKVVCVNYKEEWEKSKADALLEDNAVIEKGEDVEEDNVERNVFANFKPYNTNKKRKDSIKRRRYRIMTDKSNQFSHKGSMSDYNKREDTKTAHITKKQISFSEFKTKQL
jgi:hypothetical protein